MSQRSVSLSNQQRLEYQQSVFKGPGWICRHCGFHNAKEVRFCLSCGIKLKTNFNPATTRRRVTRL